MALRRVWTTYEGRLFSRAAEKGQRKRPLHSVLIIISSSNKGASGHTGSAAFHSCFEIHIPKASQRSQAKRWSSVSV